MNLLLCSFSNPILADSTVKAYRVSTEDLKSDLVSRTLISSTLTRYHMFRALFLLFIIVPIIEIALLIQVSEVIGGFATIALIVVTAIIGAKLVKQQGVSAMRDAQLQMAQGQMPAEQLFTGICVIVAGVLLLTPGIVTDVFGFLLLTPAIRKRMAAAFASQAQVRMTQGGGFSAHYQSMHTRTHGTEQHAVHPERDKSNTTIEGEFERKE